MYAFLIWVVSLHERMERLHDRKGPATCISLLAHDDAVVVVREVFRPMFTRVQSRTHPRAEFCQLPLILQELSSY